LNVCSLFLLEVFDHPAGLRSASRVLPSSSPSGSLHLLSLSDVLSFRGHPCFARAAAGCKTQRLCLLPAYLGCHMEPIPSEYRVNGRDGHVMQRKARVFGDCTGRMVDEILITSQVAGERTWALRDRRCRKGKSWKLAAEKKELAGRTGTGPVWQTLPCPSRNRRDPRGVG